MLRFPGEFQVGLSISEIEDLTLPRLNVFLDHFSRMHSKSEAGTKAGMATYNADSHALMIEEQRKYRESLDGD